MGLKQVKFIDWFQGKFPEAVKSIPNHEGSQFDSVFIDLNCILHPAMRTAKNETMFVKKLFSILDKLLAQFIPNRICYLSVDGPAPAAKILTQKARRAAKSSSKRSEGMSTLQLTPGCPFMSRLEHYLSYYSVRYLQHRRLLGISPDLKFVIDHSNNPGEGESKIIENIVQQAGSIHGRPCAVLTMDSDAVLQAIALGMPNIYVIRKDLPMIPAIVISIDRFMRTLDGLFPGESNQARLDFCAMCLFRGNDYLRGLAVGLEKLWRAYLYTKLADPVIQRRGALKFLIDADSKTFDLLFLKQLMTNSYSHMSKLNLPLGIEQQHKQQQQTSTLPNPPSKVGSDDYENASDMESADENDILTRDESDSDVEGGDSVIEDEDEDEENPSDDKAYSVKKFLAGILWNLEMYCSGMCPDVSFSYLYRQSPPRRALLEFVDEMAATKPYTTLQPTATKNVVFVTTSDKEYLHPLVCALILLPAEAGGKYLPQSIAGVHAQIVPSNAKYLTREEMETIDAKVQGLIEILGSSSKGRDTEIAKELSALYLTRLPYIWTRVRVVGPHAKPTAMPLSPNIIVDQQNLHQTKSATVNSDTTPPPPHTYLFPDLEPQPDIKCSMVRLPPSSASQNQSSSADGNLRVRAGVGADFVQWAAPERQEAITRELKWPSPKWPFFFIRGKAYRPPGGNSATAKPQHHQHPEHHTQHHTHPQHHQHPQHHVHPHQHPHQQQRPQQRRNVAQGEQGTLDSKTGHGNASRQPNQNPQSAQDSGFGQQGKKTKNSGGRNKRQPTGEKTTGPTSASTSSRFSVLDAESN
ncbi:hypothetical protein BGZ58_001771 [Dissophora ornata]|nr:hypothetical protein BGZ58_001771 [Dissophora ornata]